jgi:hypothetical protein
MLMVSLVFVAIGIGTIGRGEAFGWVATGFFGLCFVIALFEPRLRPHAVSSGYRVLITPEAIACEHPRRKRESIRWEDVTRIWYVTTSGGPRLPDEWLLLEGERGGCSFPTEADGFDGIWDELKQRFPGFDHGPLIRGGTDDGRHLCWERQGLTGRDT